MKVRYLLAAGIAFALSTPVVAADGASDKDAVKEKKICRTETLTGSLIARRRVCMTQAEWDQVAQASRKSVEQVERDASQSQAILSQQNQAQ
ncbi:MAG: hypothetical protein J2O44_01935 [Porphyrobacter sp.]|nr:hypothetical protein [Porphyrobacter sp.]